MIIEFMGLPGSGKTTLHAKAVQSLEEMACQVWTPEHYWEKQRPYYHRSFQGSRFNRMKNGILFINQLISKVPSVLKYFFKNRSFVLFLWRNINNFHYTLEYRVLLIKYFMIDLFPYSSFSEHAFDRNNVILIDEGLIQHMYTLFVHKKRFLEQEALRRYLSYAPLPNLLIFIESDPEVCFERMEKRGIIPYRLRGESVEVFRESLQKGKELFSMVVKLINERNLNPVQIVQLDGNFPEEATEKLKESLSIYLLQTSVS